MKVKIGNWRSEHPHAWKPPYFQSLTDGRYEYCYTDLQFITRRVSSEEEQFRIANADCATRQVRLPCRSVTGLGGSNAPDESVASLSIQISFTFERPSSSLCAKSSWRCLQLHHQWKVLLLRWKHWLWYGFGTNDRLCQTDINWIECAKFQLLWCRKITYDRSVTCRCYIIWDRKYHTLQTPWCSRGPRGLAWNQLQASFHQLQLFPSPAHRPWSKNRMWHYPWHACMETSKNLILYWHLYQIRAQCKYYSPAIKPVSKDSK